MKVIFTSSDALLDKKTNRLYTGLEEALDNFLAISKENKIYTISRTEAGLNGVPNKYNPHQVNGYSRSTNIISKFLETNGKYSYSDVVILGANDADLALASNEKVLLLTAGYAEDFVKESRVFEYGVKIKSPDRLTVFFDRFFNIDSPWYSRNVVSDKTTIYSLTNAETKTARITHDMAYLNNRFRACLKERQKEYRKLFAIYFLVSAYSEETIDELKEVKYWSIYPSSSLGLNTDLHYFKELIRKSFKGQPIVPNHERQILERVVATEKRQYKTQNQRITEGCTPELNTIRLNPWFMNKLKGETVCIIDDFTTLGTSCETARILLELAGVKKLIFITMGKFGDNYYKYDYQIRGNIFDRVQGRQIKFSKLENGKINPNANFEFVKSLKPLI